MLALSPACIWVFRIGSYGRSLQPARCRTSSPVHACRPGKKISLVPSDASLGVMQMILRREVHLADYAPVRGCPRPDPKGLVTSELARMPLINIAERR